MKKSKIIVAVLLMVVMITGMFQTAFADRFWDLYKLGDARKNSGDLIGAIDAWQQIVNLYQYDSSKDALTRSAVYSTKIAESYETMGWLGEAQKEYEKVESFWNRLGEWDSAWGPNRIATRLETDLRVYAKVPAEKSYTLGKFEPVSGAYFGSPFDKDPKIVDDLSKVDDIYGKAHTAFLMYIRWGEPIQYWTANQAKQLGAALQIAWEPPADMSTIKAQDVEKFAAELKKLGTPIFLRFACEMNEISNPWSQSSPELYKLKFKEVSQIMHRDAPNVAMVWAPLYVPMDTIPSFYPGDDAVDWVGVDAYTDRYYIGDPSTRQLIQDLYYQGYYANPLDRFKFIYDTYSAKKPIFIAETGIQNYAVNTKEDFSDWASNNMRRLYSYLPMVYPRVKAVFYFNVDSNMVPGLGLKQNYSLSRSSKVFNTYKELIQNPYYLSSVNTNSSFMYKPLESVSSDKSKGLELSTYAKIMDPFIRKTEYWLDGKKVGSSDKIPFTQNIDLTKLSDGEHVLRVDVSDNNSKLNARRMYTIKVSGSSVRFSAGEVQYISRHKVLRDINHWARTQIEELVGLWSVDGYDDGMFKPEKSITHAEFYKILSTSLGMGLQTNTNKLSNVTDHWGKGLLEGGVQLGIITPLDYNNKALIDQPITRAEMAMWSVRALNGGQASSYKETQFIDNAQINQKYKGYISDAYSYGIIDGFPDNSFRPNDTATRAQAVSMIIRAVQYQNTTNQ